MRNPTLLALVALLSGAAASAQPATVAPLRETTPQASASGGAVEDVALWVNPADAGASLLLTAQGSAGLITFGVDGQQVDAELADGPTVSVSARDDFPLGGGNRTLVVTANSNFNGLTAYRVDPGGADRVLRIGAPGAFAAGPFTAVALYRASSGSFYAFAGSQNGRLEQFELTGADGGVTATPVRVLRTTGGAIEGIAADEETGLLFVTEAGQGLWRYSAVPDGGTDRTQVSALGGGQLSLTVGRVALYPASNGEGYLLVADTGADAFAVFERRSQAFIGTFRMVQDGGIDSVEAPAALAVSPRPVGPDFPEGLFAGHDGTNSPSPENLKLASWGAVARAFDPALRIETSQVTDGGADGGADAGADSGPPVRPPPNPPISGNGGDEGGGCSCATASVPASAVLALLALALAGRRRRS
ncbi:phytase [Myxococcus sp. RHST-1-4]|nr:phytase [Myxococcus sp. RHSTA-1-4]